MNRNTKILFVYPYLSSFIKADLEILQRHFDVTPIQWTRTRDIKTLTPYGWGIAHGKKEKFEVSSSFKSVTIGFSQH